MKYTKTTSQPDKIKACAVCYSLIVETWHAGSLLLCLLLLSLMLLTSCYRDDLCFLHPDGAVIELKIDWSRAKLAPNSATAVIYKDGAYFRTEIFSVHPPVRKVIFLHEGNYSIALFNEQSTDFERNLLFAGREQWSTFEARAIDDYTANLFAKAVRSLKADVDTLAVDRTSFEVTHEMVHSVHKDPISLEQAGLFDKIAHSVTFVPKRTFTTVDVVLKVKNGSGYFFTQRNPAVLNGTSESYFLGTDLYSESTVRHPLKFVQLPKPTTQDTVISMASMQVVGLRDWHDSTLVPGSLPYSLTLPFTYSGGIMQKEIDLRTEAKRFEYTPQYTPGTNRPYDHLYIELELELPPLITVGGMDATVEDWTDVDIPLDGPSRLHFLANNGSKEVFWWNNTPGITVHLPVPLFTPVPSLTFREWNSDPEGKGDSFLPGHEYTMKRGGSIFYAIWDRTDLPLQTLYFVANNGSTDQITARRKPGDLIPIPANYFSPPTGKQFKQWNSSPDGKGTPYMPNDPFRVVQDDTRFYAIWQ